MCTTYTLFFFPESNELCIVYTVNLSTAHLGALEVLNIYIDIDLQIAIFSIFLSPKKMHSLQIVIPPASFPKKCIE